MADDTNSQIAELKASISSLRGREQALCAASEGEGVSAEAAEEAGRDLLSIRDEIEATQEQIAALDEL